MLSSKSGNFLDLQQILELRQAGDWDAVERISRAQFARNRRDGEAAWQQAYAQWRRHDPVAAEATMRIADIFTPGNANIITALAQFVAEQGRYDEARQLYERAIALDPSVSTPSVDLAELELRNGEWSRGWARYEGRFMRTDRTSENIVSVMARRAPRWIDQPLAGRTLLVYSEQGHGDDIQMVRFVPQLAARVRSQGGTLVLACRRALYPVFARYYEPCIEIEAGEYAKHGTPDYCLPMMSLPLALGLQPWDVHGAPYLKPGASRIAEWHSRVREAASACEALQVGLVWRGSPTHRRDEQRSMSLMELAPLLALNSVVWHPLTPGHAALPPAVTHCDLTTCYRDGFEDVAAHVCALDAVVTIDSSPLHLGGALGVPVFAMLDQVSHWCWGTGETQPWYDSVTLFRQSRPGDWEPVVARVANAVGRLAAARRRASAAPTPGRLPQA